MAFRVAVYPASGGIVGSSPTRRATNGKAGRYRPFLLRHFGHTYSKVKGRAGITMVIQNFDEKKEPKFPLTEFAALLSYRHRLSLVQKTS